MLFWCMGVDDRSREVSEGAVTPTVSKIYGGQSRFHTSAVAKIVALIRTVLTRPGTRILNVADPKALTVAKIGASIREYLANEGSLLPLDIGDDRAMLRSAQLRGRFRRRLR
jgi:hypothetical protein